MSLINLTNDNFDNEVLNSDKPVLVDFFATWCGPCRMVSPVVDKLAEEEPDKKICKVDVDKAPELAQRYSVASVPTLIVFKDGKAVNVSVGVKNKQEILEMFKA